MPTHIKRNIKITWVLIATIIFGEVPAQPCSDSIKVNTDRLLVIGAGTIGLMAASYGLQDNIWWKGEKSSFHFNWTQDWKANLGADKFGHMYFSYLASNLYIEAYNWAGLNRYEQRLYGGISAMVHQTFTEIRDGFSKEYGFSFGDYAFNLVGAFYPLLQYEYPLLESFRFKISYYPSDRFKAGSNNYIIDDYESTYNWLSIDINNLLTGEAGKYFPDFVDLTIGHSVKNLGINAKHEFYIGLDWDFEALPGNNAILKFLKKSLNFYHFPSPVVKIYPNVVWYGLKF